MGYGWHNDAMGSGWWVLVMVGMFAFLAVFVIGAVLLVRHYGQPHNDHRVGTSAIEILQQRFARGELSEEEYTRNLELLKGQS